MVRFFHLVPVSLSSSEMVCAPCIGALDMLAYSSLGRSLAQRVLALRFPLTLAPPSSRLQQRLMV